MDDVFDKKIIGGVGAGAGLAHFWLGLPTPWIGAAVGGLVAGAVLTRSRLQVHDRGDIALERLKNHVESVDDLYWFDTHPENEDKFNFEGGERIVEMPDGTRTSYLVGVYGVWDKDHPGTNVTTQLYIWDDDEERIIKSVRNPDPEKRRRPLKDYRKTKRETGRGGVTREDGPEQQVVLNQGRDGE